MATSDSIAFVEKRNRGGSAWIRKIPAAFFSRNALIAACILLVLWITFYLRFAMVSRPHTLRSPETPTLERIDRICAEDAADCFVVSDFVDWRREEAWRMLRSEKATEESDAESHFSRVALKMQNDSSPSREWPVDHSRILAQYLAVMTAIPFALEAFPAPRATILSIGLGGGVLDVFLHLHRPLFEITVVERERTIADIAHAWFGVLENSKRKTEIADGIDFLRTAATSGRQFDVIFVDACDLNDRDATCPAAAFAERGTAADFSDALPRSGVVVLNVVARSGHTEKYFRRVLDAFFFYFPLCLKAEMPSGNVVLACAKTANHADDENALRDAITRNWNEAADEFAMREMLRSVNITVFVKER